MSISEGMKRAGQSSKLAVKRGLVDVDDQRGRKPRATRAPRPPREPREVAPRPPMPPPPPLRPSRWEPVGGETRPSLPVQRRRTSSRELLESAKRTDVSGALLREAADVFGDEVYENLYTHALRLEEEIGDAVDDIQTKHDVAVDAGVVHFERLERRTAIINRMAAVATKGNFDELFDILDDHAKELAEEAAEDVATKKAAT